jgi:hypothetical protein
MAVKPGLDFPDTLNIHDCGAMYPQELSRVELLFKAGEGLAEFVLAFADVKTDVVAISLGTRSGNLRRRSVPHRPHGRCLCHRTPGRQSESSRFTFTGCGASMMAIYRQRRTLSPVLKAPDRSHTRFGLTLVVECIHNYYSLQPGVETQRS